ncbi:MAG TPA: hypothetical protein VFV50_06535 [Bdellovibrionales bacterium]|nr:hypothetical protein [Bdellovibrionales bacterium]
MRTKRRIACLVGIFSLAISGCIEQGGTGALSASDENLSPRARVYFEQASLADIVPHKVDCPASARADGREKICIQICHVPPGNPSAAHDKTLPIAAMKAHLGHGDYLGLCDAGDMEEPPVDDEPGEGTDDGAGGETGGGTDVGTGDGADDGTGDGTEGETPLWCEPYVDVDSDCDGIVDSTEEPYF